MSELPELTQEQKKLMVQIEQARLAQVRDAERNHADRLADIERDYRLGMVAAGLEAVFEPAASAPPSEQGGAPEYINVTDEQIQQVYEKHRPLMDALEKQERQDLIHWNAEKDRALADAQAKITELTAALKPFAAWAEVFEDSLNGVYDASRVFYMMNDVKIMYTDMQRALNAYRASAANADAPAGE